MKRLVALVLCCLLMAGCLHAFAEERAMVGNMYVEGFPVLKETESFTVAVTKDAGSMNGFAEKACTIETEKLTNIHIDWLDIPVSAWTEQVNIMIAGDNLPDAFLGANVDVMLNLSTFVPLEDYIKEYAPNIQEMLDTDPDIRRAVTAPDGHIYSLPTGAVMEPDTVGPVLWINGEWLDKLGLEMPTTTDEFTEVLRAFKTQDPNGNGIADEIPLTGRQSEYTQCLYPLLGAFGTMDSPQEHVYDKEGTVYFGASQDGYFEGLKWLHQLYSEGLLDNEVFTMEHAQLTAKGQNPDTIIGSVIYWLPDAMDPRYIDFIPMDPLKGPNGDQMWIANSLPVGELQGFSITKACKHPEVLIRYYDTAMSSFDMAMLWKYGPEGGGTWKYVDREAGTWMTTTEFVPEGMSQQYFNRTVSASIYAPNYIWSKWADKEILSERFALKVVGNNKCLAHAVYRMPKGSDTPERTEQRNLLFTDIDNYIQQFFATSVVNGIDEQGWQAHLENLKRLNVDQYVALWQEFCDMKNAN